VIEFRHNGGRDDHAPVQRGQDADFFNENQIADLNRRRRSLRSSVAIRRGGPFGLSLLPETSAGCALSLEVIDAVLERHTVTLQEPVEIVARRDVQELTELVTGDPVHSIGVDRKRLQGSPRQIFAVFGKLLDGRVRDVQPDLHDFSIEQPFADDTRGPLVIQFRHDCGRDEHAPV